MNDYNEWLQDVQSLLGRSGDPDTWANEPHKLGGSQREQGLALMNEFDQALNAGRSLPDPVPQYGEKLRHYL